MILHEQMARAKRLVKNGLYHLALDELAALITHVDTSSPADELSDLYNETGKVYLALSSVRHSIEMFAKARDASASAETHARAVVNLATAYGRIGELDTAHRYLQSLAREMPHLPARSRGHLLLNMATIHGLNGHTQAVIESIEEALRVLHGASIHDFDDVLLNNLGVAYLELGAYDAAESHLLQAMEGSGPTLHVLSTLGRVYFYQGRMQESLRCAEAALRLVWSAFVNYEKEEVARLCQLLTLMAQRAGETYLSARLAEKAQVLFGQLGMWREWAYLEGNVSSDDGASSRMPMPPGFIQQVAQFLECLDAIQSQELIDPRMSSLLDVRAHYTRLFTESLGLTDAERDRVILAARLMDYGMTALEPEVIRNPRRSPQAWEQFRQHPYVGAQMVRSLRLPPDLEPVIMDHHEHYDGSGYPAGKTGSTIHPLARILAVVDLYAQAVTRNRATHAEALACVEQARNAALDPNVADAFIAMFHAMRN